VAGWRERVQPFVQDPGVDVCSHSVIDKHGDIDAVGASLGLPHNAA
jgi:hypothetical protein